MSFRKICAGGLVSLSLFLLGCKGRPSVAMPDGSDRPNPDVAGETPDGDESDEKPAGTDSPNDEPKDYAYSGHDAVCLDQGWDDAERRRFYYLGQGSQLVPYNWFLALELPDSNELLKSDRHLA